MTTNQTNLSRTLLYVVNDPLFFLSHRLNIAKAALNKGLRVIVAVPPDPGCDEIQAKGFEVIYIPLQRWSGNPWAEIRCILTLIKLYRSIKPDIVHHVTIKPVLYGSIAARLAMLPRVINAVSGRGQVFSNKGIKAYVRRLLVNQLYRFAFGSRSIKVIFQNPEDQEYFISRRIITPVQSTLIRGAGVDCSQFHPTPESHGKPKIVLAARLLWEKGVGDFVEASRLLAQNGLEFECIVMGPIVEGNPGAISARQIREWEQNSPCTFLGNSSDMAKVLAGSHIFCLPTYYGEGVPKALIEAAFSGRPIVTTDWPGCREVVKHNYNGLLVPPRNPEQLAMALMSLIKNPELRQEMGTNGRKLVMAGGFSSAAVVESTLDLYE
jgi:glycosyltransferase involved in cell wall biosynthesis